MKKLAAIILAIILIFSLTACERGARTFNVGFLKGPTGMGAAKMLAEGQSGYNFRVEADAANINAALISGDLHIAAVPTNAASVLYNKTEGKVHIAAINTLGVLHILENGDAVSSVTDLRGRTIYATGQGSNPQYVLEYILTENGLTPGEDVFIEYLSSDELTTKMAEGMVDLCMLPVPAVTTVMVKNPDVRDALDLTAEWEALTGVSLTQGCIVYRSDLVTEKQLKGFLEDYEKSVNYMSKEENLDAAASLCAKQGIVGSEAIAKKALPQCAIVYIDGADTIKEYLTDYYDILFAAAPQSMGGSVPDDAFYK